MQRVGLAFLTALGADITPLPPPEILTARVFMAIVGGRGADGP